MHAKASIGGTVIAETDSYEVVENNIYFPPSAIKDEDILTKTSHTTHCPWKGDAAYYTLNVGGKKLENAAWYYPQPFEKAQNIKDYVAFYKTKVQIESS